MRLERGRISSFDGLTTFAHRLERRSSAILASEKQFPLLVAGDASGNFQSTSGLIGGQEALNRHWAFKKIWSPTSTCREQSKTTTKVRPGVARTLFSFSLLLLSRNVTFSLTLRYTVAGVKRIAARARLRTLAVTVALPRASAVRCCLSLSSVTCWGTRAASLY